LSCIHIVEAMAGNRAAYSCSPLDCALEKHAYVPIC
jgi:hypothetical protein